MANGIQFVLQELADKKEEISQIKGSADGSIRIIRSSMSSLEDQIREQLNSLVNEVVSLAGMSKKHVSLYFDGGPDWSTTYYVSSEGQLRIKHYQGQPKTAKTRDIVNLILGGNNEVYDNLMVALDTLGK